MLSASVPNLAVPRCRFQEWCWYHGGKWKAGSYAACCCFGAEPLLAGGCISASLTVPYIHTRKLCSCSQLLYVEEFGDFDSHMGVVVHVRSNLIAEHAERI